MTNFNKNNEKKTTQRLPMTGKVKKGFHTYCAVVTAATLVFGMSVTAFAANDPITVVNNLSDFIFGLGVNIYFLERLGSVTFLGGNKYTSHLYP